VLSTLQVRKKLGYKSIQFRTGVNELRSCVSGIENGVCSRLLYEKNAGKIEDKVVWWPTPGNVQYCRPSSAHRRAMKLKNKNN
jgi:hypothetical protein